MPHKQEVSRSRGERWLNVDSPHSNTAGCLENAPTARRDAAPKNKRDTCTKQFGGGLWPIGC